MEDEPLQTITSKVEDEAATAISSSLVCVSVITIKIASASVLVVEDIQVDLTRAVQSKTSKQRA